MVTIMVVVMKFNTVKFNLKNRVKEPMDKVIK